MEEKSVEIPKIKGPLREQDSIRALLELLEQQGMEQEKGDVIRMADHIDSMEMQLGTVLKENRQCLILKKIVTIPVCVNVPFRRTGSV